MVDGPHTNPSSYRQPFSPASGAKAHARTGRRFSVSLAVTATLLSFPGGARAEDDGLARRFVAELARMEGKIRWKQAHFAARKDYGRFDGGDFRRWMDGELDAIPEQGSMACWEAPILAAHRIGVLPRDQIIAARDRAAQLAVVMRDWNELPADMPETMTRLDVGMISYYETLFQSLGLDKATRPSRDQPLRRGDIVFAGHHQLVRHVMVATGERIDGVPELYSLWSGPRPLRNRNQQPDTLQRTTLPALIEHYAELLKKEPLGRKEMVELAARYVADRFLGSYRVASFPWREATGRPPRDHHQRGGRRRD